MDVVQFDNLLQMVYELIKKEDTQMRMVIPPKKQTIEVTLRYLATGDSFKSLEYLFRVLIIYTRSAYSNFSSPGTIYQGIVIQI